MTNDQDNAVLRKVKELEQRLGAIERWNQARRVISNGQIVYDEIGLVSENNFQLGSVTLASLFTTSSISYVDVTGMELTFTLDRSIRVLVGVFTIGLNTKAGISGAGGNVRILRNGFYQRQLSVSGNYNPHSVDNIRSLYSSWTNILNLPAGTHTLKLTANCNDASAVTHVEEASMYYIILGK